MECCEGEIVEDELVISLSGRIVRNGEDKFSIELDPSVLWMDLEELIVDMVSNIPEIESRSEFRVEIRLR